MKSLLTLFAVLAVAAPASPAAPSTAAVSAQSSAAPFAGVWKINVGGDGAITYLTLVLTDQKGDLTGKLTRQGGVPIGGISDGPPSGPELSKGYGVQLPEGEITSISVQDDVISFSLSGEKNIRRPNGRRMTVSTYSGKLDGNKIKGSIKLTTQDNQTGPILSGKEYIWEASRTK